MKTATLTFHNAINYGAMLQTYALQKSIENLGYENIIIDYKCEAIDNAYKLIKFYNFRNPISYVKYKINYKKNIKRTKLFEKFASSNLRITTKSYKTKESLYELNDIFDKFICGSDQVWNYNITKNDYTYLLDFVSDKRKKNSYAASFGAGVIKSEFKSQYKNLLEDYNNISVREIQGQKIIKELTSLNCPVVLDPTLLLDKEMWKKVTSKDIKFKNYILLYLLIETDTIFKFVNKLAQFTGLEVIYININQDLRPNMTNVRDIGPSEWIELLINADYVVTNSFHGALFSINFNKDFFVELLPSQIDVNSRFDNMLDAFNLSSRQIIEGGNRNIDESIDYRPINEILEQERTKSIAYLKTILSENNEQN